jgi:hypothetical protein
MLNANFTQGISIIENIKEASDGTIYASGFTNGNLPILFKLSANGDIIWIKEITLPGTYSFSINNILPLPDNGAVVSCGTYTAPYNFVVIRIDANGNNIWQKEYKKDLKHQSYYFAIN